MAKHVVNGDRAAGWYCYQCDFSTRDVGEGAAHDGVTLCDVCKKATSDGHICPECWQRYEDQKVEFATKKQEENGHKPV